jgi:hypothetical protein
MPVSCQFKFCPVTTIGTAGLTLKLESPSTVHGQLCHKRLFELGDDQRNGYSTLRPAFCFGFPLMLSFRICPGISGPAPPLWFHNFHLGLLFFLHRFHRIADCEQTSHAQVGNMTGYGLGDSKSSRLSPRGWWIMGHNYILKTPIASTYWQVATGSEFRECSLHTGTGPYAPYALKVLGHVIW